LSSAKPTQTRSREEKVGNMKAFLVISAIVVLLTLTVVGIVVPAGLADANKESPFYIGVAFCGNTTAEAKLLIDRVQPYTNLFVLQSWAISRNETAVYEVCDYAVARGLNLIVNLGTKTQSTWAWQLPVWTNGSTRWGDKFLGAYYDDEPGGIQIDYNWNEFFVQHTNYVPLPKNSSAWGAEVYMKLLAYKINGTVPQDYSAEAKFFLDAFNLNVSGLQELRHSGIKTFVSDYALHWFDYKGGYDVVFAQFGSNNSYVNAISQVRGAARLQNKEWGAIITWKYMQPPYLDTGEEIYKQMFSAYQAGAKYVIIFDYTQTSGNPYGSMQDEHFAALERFSNDVVATSKMRTVEDSGEANAVLVLPSNYGFGLRRPDDKIWGFWGPDGKSAQVWNITQKLTAQYGVHLDIVFDDPEFPIMTQYAHVYCWNQTV
jgi:hypothetical protein